MDSATADVIVGIACIEWVAALISNGCVLNIVITKTFKENRHFSIIIGVMSLTLIIISGIGWFTLNRQLGISEDGAFVFLMFGFCSFFPASHCFTADTIVFNLVEYYLMLVPFTMIYRMFVFYRKPVKELYLRLMLLALAIPSIYLLIYMLQLYVPPSELQISERLANITEGKTHYGVRVTKNWQGTLFHYLQYQPHLCFLVTMFGGLLFIYKLKKSASGVSQRSQKLHKKFVAMLMIQSCIPLTLVITNSVAQLNKQDADTSPVLASLSYVFLGLSPSLDAFAVLYFVPYHKAIVKGWLAPGHTNDRVSVISRA